MTDQAMRTRLVVMGFGILLAAIAGMHFAGWLSRILWPILR